MREKATRGGVAFSRMEWFSRALVFRSLYYLLSLRRNAPPRATAGHLPVPGVGHLQILRCPGAGHLPTPRLFPSCWHACGFLSKYNYTEDFTGKTSIIGLSAKDKKTLKSGCKGISILCMHFFIAYQGRITWWNRELSMWINVFWLNLKWIKFQLILFEEHPFIFLKPFNIQVANNFIALY